LGYTGWAHKFSNVDPKFVESIIGKTGVEHMQKLHQKKLVSDQTKTKEKQPVKAK
jgi:hypothetical protein